MSRLARVATGLSCALLAASSSALAQSTRPADTNPGLSAATVAVPLPELLSLMDRARGDAGKAAVDFVFSPATYTGTVTNDVARLETTLGITLLRTGYVLVPIGPADAGIESATLDGQPSPLVVRDGQLNVLLGGPGPKSLAIVMRRPVTLSGGVSRISVPFAPTSAVNEVVMTLPSQDLFADAADGAVTAIQPGPNNSTRATATYRGIPAGSMSWRPRPAGVVEARLTTDTQTRIALRRGVLRYHSTMKISIERGATAAIAVKLDPQALLVSATGKDVARVTEQGAGDARTVAIAFGQAIQGERTIELIYEKDIADAGAAVAIAPPVLVNARSDAGVVAVESDGAYDVRPTAGTMERLSVSELPATLRGQTTTLAYRYAAAGTSATLAATAVKPQPAKLFALTQTRVAVDRGVLRCQANVAYEILNAGVESFRIALPAGADLVQVDGTGIRDTQVINENNARFVVVGLKDLAKKQYALTVTYDVRFAEQAAGKPATRPAGAPATAATATAKVAVPVIGHPDAADSRGFVGIEVRGGYELAADVTGAERIDVREVPQQLWSIARSPLQLAYRYQAGTPALSLAMTRHQDLDVLVAMSDACEATTTVTPDGRAITKLMYVTRNNLKPFMTLKLPEGAEVWSTFVDDRPVTPVRTADGRVLIPLKKSDDVGDDDEDSYRARRDRRRAGTEHELREIVKKQMELRDDQTTADLKPYDVEVVFVTPAIKIGDRGQIDMALPQSDVPIGHLAWAVFLPKSLRVVDSTGNLAEVQRFTLPFRHFADAEVQRLEKLDKAVAQQQALQKLEQAAAKQAEAAKVAGVLPVRVEIPVVGNIHRFEKLLTVDETPKLSLTYSRRLD